MEQALKLLPPITEWHKLSGEGEKNHVSFIEFFEYTLSSYELPDLIAVVRLPRIFEGVALDWFINKREEVGSLSWNSWKELIKVQFGTRIWKRKMMKTFETSQFDPSKDKPHKWCLDQKKRLDCFYPDADKEEVNERLLNLCPRQINHRARFRMPIYSDLSTLIGVLEETIDMNGLDKRVNRLPREKKY